jgi:hypothetical protein
MTYYALTVAIVTTVTFVMMYDFFNCSYKYNVEGKNVAPAESAAS